MVRIKRKLFSYLGLVVVLASAAKHIFSMNFHDFNEFRPIDFFFLVGFLFAFITLIRCLIFSTYIIEKNANLIIYDVFFTKRVKISDIKEVKLPNYPWQSVILVSDNDFIKIDSFNLNERDKVVLKSLIS